MMMRQLTEAGCRARQNLLMANAAADLIILCNPRHIQYMSGMFISPLMLAAWGHNYLVLDIESGRTTLLVHNGLAAAAEAAHVDDVRVWQRYDALHTPTDGVFDGAFEMFEALLPQWGGLHIAAEAGLFPSGIWDTTEDITPALADMRRSKHADELALIEEAQAVAAAGHAAARAMIAAGVSELDVYHSVQQAMQNTFGAPLLLLGDYVSSGRDLLPGGAPTTRTLRDGDVMIIDTFPIVNGYRADITATLAVGTPSDQQLRLNSVLHQALAAGETLLQPGVPASALYEAVADTITAGGFGDGIRHHAGHGLGLDHPEAPYFVADSQEVLRVGDVVTLEPGAYGADYGARIEHNYLITAAGAQRLSAHETQLF
jgi:Xaa-Pro aminopeptidase